MKFRQPVIFVLLSALCLLQSACELSSPDVNNNDDAPVCSTAADDQKGSFMSPVESYPVTITLDDRFTPQERESLVQAIGVWNRYAEEKLGRTLFRYEIGGVAPLLTEHDLQGCEMNFGDKNAFPVIRVGDSERWHDLGFSDITPAATLRCQTRRIVLRQAVLINPGLFSPRQITSIFLHELGHSVGLDHSCDGSDSGRSDFLSCSLVSWNHPYRVAVMYPTLRIGAGASSLVEIKEDLRTNDKERAHCVVK